MSISLFSDRDSSALSQFTVYSADGKAALHAARYPEGVALETRGDLILDKPQIKSLMVWLGMELDG